MFQPDTIPTIFAPPDSTGAASMFGPQSIPGDGTAVPGGDQAFRFITDTPAYSLTVLLCFIGYCMIIYYYCPHVAAVVNMFRGTLYVERLQSDQNYVFGTFLNLITGLGLLMCGVMIVKFADAFFGADFMAAVPGWAAGLPVPGLWLVLGVVWLLQALILRVSGALTYNTVFTASLERLRKLTYSLLFIVAIPVMLMLSLAGPTGSGIFSVVLGAVVLAMLIFLLMRTYLLFVVQKISILYWFLYLCGVEIFPVSFPVVLALRLL